MNDFLLDTHVWTDIQLGEDPNFDPKLRRELERAQMRGLVGISAISILEITRLVAAGRRTLPCSVEELVAQATADGGLRLHQLSPGILIDSTRLPGEVHRDPADRLIVATARAHGLTLITRDKHLLAYAKQGHLSARKP